MERGGGPEGGWGRIAAGMSAGPARGKRLVDRARSTRRWDTPEKLVFQNLENHPNWMEIPDKHFWSFIPASPGLPMVCLYPGLIKQHKIFSPESIEPVNFSIIAQPLPNGSFDAFIEIKELYGKKKTFTYPLHFLMQVLSIKSPMEFLQS